LGPAEATIEVISNIAPLIAAKHRYKLLNFRDIENFPSLGFVKKLRTIFSTDIGLFDIGNKLGLCQESVINHLSSF